MNPRPRHEGRVPNTVTTEVHSVRMGDIRSVGVAGGGTMGFGIAVNFALAGYPTAIYDLADEVLERSLANVRAALELFVEEGLVTGHSAMDRRPRGQSQPSPGAERGGPRQDPGTHGRAPPVAPRPGPHRGSRWPATANSSAAARRSTASPATAHRTKLLDPLGAYRDQSNREEARVMTDSTSCTTTLGS